MLYRKISASKVQRQNVAFLTTQNIDNLPCSLLLIVSGMPNRQHTDLYGSNRLAGLKHQNEFNL